jgi:hypothetical protein
MNTPTEISWEEARKFADAQGQDEVIIVCRSLEPKPNGVMHVLTWGRTPALSASAAEGGNKIKDLCWSGDAPHNDRPAWLMGLIQVYRAAKKTGAAELEDVLERYEEIIEEKIKA